MHPLLNYGRGIRDAGPMPSIEILRRFGFRQAIKATEIATIGDADTQVAQDATVRVNKLTMGRHFGGCALAGGELVAGGMTFTEPSELTSTLRS